MPRKSAIFAELADMILVMAIKDVWDGPTALIKKLEKAEFETEHAQQRLDLELVLFCVFPYEAVGTTLWPESEGPFRRAIRDRLQLHVYDDFRGALARGDEHLTHGMPNFAEFHQFVDDRLVALAAAYVEALEGSSKVNFGRTAGSFLEGRPCLDQMLWMYLTGHLFTALERVPPILSTLSPTSTGFVVREPPPPEER